jgi:hypothetical protein
MKCKRVTSRFPDRTRAYGYLWHAGENLVPELMLTLIEKRAPAGAIRKVRGGLEVGPAAAQEGGDK